MENTKTKTLVLVAGGSGGHITPVLCLARTWPGSLLFFGSKAKLDQTILASQGVVWLKLMNFPGKKVWNYPRFFLQFIIAFIKSFFILRKTKPEKIITTGGYLAIPVALAGRLLRIPLELYSLDLVPGKAILFLTPLAQQVYITFEKSKKYFKHSTVIPYPLRFTSQDKLFNKETIINRLNFSPTKKTIFLLGGSQGSIFLNKLLKTWIATNTPSNIQVIHQTGSLDTTNWKDFYKAFNIPALTFSYDENIKDFYLFSDVVIARGGAGTLFELEFFQRPSIIIPLKHHASDHQVENAQEMANRSKLFHILDQDTLTLEIFSNTINQILHR